MTRAKQWLIVVGEPITLCTVGSNRLLWGEFIKNCQQYGIFEYSNAEKFESCLEDKIVVRLGKFVCSSLPFPPPLSLSPLPSLSPSPLSLYTYYIHVSCFTSCMFFFIPPPSPTTCRQLLEKQYSEFFGKLKHLKVSTVFWGCYPPHSHAKKNYC